MERYDYVEAVKNDIREYLKDKGVGYVDPDGDERQELEDEMFVSDSVTGNVSGSYTFSTWKAEEYLCHNSDLLKEALESFDGEFTSPEGNDVTIRCYLLNQCFTAVLEEWNEDWKREHPESEEDDEDGDEDAETDAEDEEDA